MERHRHLQVLGVAWEGPTGLRVRGNIANILHFSLTVPEMWDTALCGRGCHLGFFRLRLPGAEGPGFYLCS